MMENRDINNIFNSPYSKIQYLKILSLSFKTLSIMQYSSNVKSNMIVKIEKLSLSIAKSDILKFLNCFMFFLRIKLKNKNKYVNNINEHNV